MPEICLYWRCLIPASHSALEGSHPVRVDPFVDLIADRGVRAVDGLCCLAGRDVDPWEFASDQLRYVGSDSQCVGIGALRAVVAGIGPDADGVFGEVVHVVVLFF